MNPDMYSHYGSRGIGAGPVIVMLAFTILMIASMWRVFTKAGKPGWAAIVPIYNIVVLLEIAGKPVWWLVLFLIPGVSFIASILVMAGLSNNFGKGGGFTVGLILLSPIFLPILAFGSSQYRRPVPPPFGMPMGMPMPQMQQQMPQMQQMPPQYRNY